MPHLEGVVQPKLQSTTMFTYNHRAFMSFVALFIIESLIAIFVHDAIIRPFFGDFLAVIGLFFLLKSFLNLSDKALILISLGFSYFLELLQYLDFLTWSGLKSYRLLAIIIGSSFDWGDILSYTLGALALASALGLTARLTHQKLIK